MPLKTMIVPPEADGMKAALFLRRIFPYLPESAIRRAFSERDVKLDHIRISRNEPVHSGQTFSVFLPALSGQTDCLRVVYEDDHMLLVNKPAGISVEPDKPGALSLTDLCRLHVSSDFSPVPCHRLDNKTSGLCLFAKSKEAQEVLTEAFRMRTVEKYYICLVRGIMKPSSAVCSAWLLKSASSTSVRILDHEVPGARPIVTGYETLSSGPVSRLRVHLITGRTHQIRAHLSALGHPVLGDDLYGDRSFNRQMKSRSLKLCATELTLFTGGRFAAVDGHTFMINPPF